MFCAQLRLWLRHGPPHALMCPVNCSIERQREQQEQEHHQHRRAPAGSSGWRTSRWCTSAPRPSPPRRPPPPGTAQASAVAAAAAASASASASASAAASAAAAGERTSGGGAPCVAEVVRKKGCWSLKPFSSGGPGSRSHTLQPASQHQQQRPADPAAPATTAAAAAAPSSPAGAQLAPKLLLRRGARLDGLHRVARANLVQHLLEASQRNDFGQ